MITDRVFKFLSKSYQLELESYTVGKIYRHLLWHSILLTGFIIAASWLMASVLPFSLFKAWGFPTFLITNITLGITYFTYKKQYVRFEGLWVNWLTAVLLVISTCFAFLPWVSFSFLSLSMLILCSLLMSLTPILAVIFLMGSEKLWFAAVVPTMTSLIVYSASAWLQHVAFGQWLAIWCAVLTLMIFVVQKRYNKLYSSSLDRERSIKTSL